ncbi:MAG: alpha-ketoglutarate-dependent dioxygenase AlkB [Oligoflexia bacterium]|nr:alpha-ketoglutarate-dependent dioxygenase AlkB [Oligoflexia bacterium]
MKKIPGLYYNRFFVSAADRREILEWLSGIYPIWEYRYSENNPPHPGETQRQLLRPVYWLGNWQFACLNYYHPPKGIHNRCVRAEPFPAPLLKLVKKIEGIARKMYSGRDMPEKWHLNTCLLNFYGSRVIQDEDGEKRIDTARVGEHKDFEPGPVASISLGERAMFQFVSSQQRGERDGVVLQQWLDDGSLQIFGSHRWKNQLFHRVQRVDRREGILFPVNVEGFETRRLNFTFRYVPDEHIVPYSSLPAKARDDVRGYMQALAKNSEFFEQELKKTESKKSGQPRPK